MDCTALGLDGVVLLTTPLFRDERGCFRETYRHSQWIDWGLSGTFVQDNYSRSKKGTLRGMHFQRTPGQTKLVTVLMGEIFDVVVDIRPTSPTFRKWVGVTLSGERGEQLLIPIGFAHGFCVLSEEAHVIYKVSSPYDADEERCFRFDDPAVGIEWPVQDPLLSPRDLQAPLLNEVVSCAFG